MGKTVVRYRHNIIKRKEKLMLKLWHDLDKKFSLTGHPTTTATTRCLILIAMLIFWWTYKYHLETHSRQRAFRAFFDIENEGKSVKQIGRENLKEA